MAEKYFVECACGTQVRVALHDAGTQKECHSCHQRVNVPDTITLQQSSGDKYPMLRPLEKVMRTLIEEEPPFDGVCHHCGQADAVYLTPIRLNILVERFMKHDGRIRPTLSGNIILEAAAAEETRQKAAFPLLHCADCYREFEKARSAASQKYTLQLLGVIGLLIAFLVFAFFNAAVVAALAGILSLIGAIAWAARFRDTKKFDPFITPWLDDVRWVPEALAQEDEYELTIGTSEKLTKPKT